MKMLHQVLRSPLHMLLFLFCIAMLWAVVLAPAILNIKTASNTFIPAMSATISPIIAPAIGTKSDPRNPFTSVLLVGLAGTAIMLMRCRKICLATAMSCDRGGKKANASTRGVAKKAEDKGVLDLAVEFASFKRCFAAAKLIGDEKSLLKEYRQCYGYRADLIGLVWQAFNEVCGKHKS